MNRLKIGFLKKSNKFIGILLSILGFGAAYGLMGCEYGTPNVEYGTPNATFIVKGEVKSASGSSAIPSVRVVLGYDTAYSDASGKYEVKVGEFPEDQVFLVEFRDVDGSENGEYQPLDTLVEFIDPEFTGGDGGWDAGETSKDVDVNMKSVK
ncbi:MAG: radical SAM-associated putative lipoprotein [Bacteroidales bacterium]|nr:radical SAM-associated putative lipoprotein [Bacteroidales bacterium]